jgi:hypothetical protein
VPLNEQGDRFGIAKHVDDQIDLARGTANFESARVARFPIIGQITEPTREFHPPATSFAVTDRGIYVASTSDDGSIHRLPL